MSICHFIAQRACGGVGGIKRAGVGPGGKGRFQDLSCTKYRTISTFDMMNGILKVVRALLRWAHPCVLGLISPARPFHDAACTSNKGIV
jgi:hypothetical protein